MLKVLFVNNFHHPDYLCNAVYIGLSNDKNIELFTYCVPAHLLKQIGWNDKICTNSKHPLGVGYAGYFLSGKVENPPYIETPMQIIDKIYNKYYDKIVFGSIWRDRQFLWDAENAGYKREDIICLDGEDYQDPLHLIAEKTLYFKREIYSDEYKNTHVKPITFGIPDDLLLEKIPNKERFLATVIPGNTSTYIFTDEKSYFDDYKKSYFGLTVKKGGWDCLRHYEIIANRCVPYFPNIENCPKKTLVNFPKELIRYSNSFVEKNKIPNDYETINNELFEHAKNNLTCSSLVKQIFL